MPDRLTAVMSSHEENGTNAHCRRVAALTSEVAEQLDLPAADRQLLLQASLLHHSPLEFMEEPTLARLAADLWSTPIPERKTRVPADPPATPEVKQVLDQLHPWCSGNVSTHISRLAVIIELCDLYDQRLEYAPYANGGEIDPARDLSEISDACRWPRELAACLNRFHCIGEEELTRGLEKLAVSPTVAMQLLRLPPDEESRFEELLKLTRSDQALALELLRVANSSSLSPRNPMSSVESALAYVGVEEARRVLMAASFRPLLSSSSLNSLWRHSLEAAGISERLAMMSDTVEPGQAYLAGLIHDVGRLALYQLRPDHAKQIVSLTEAGAPPVYAELILCGADHGGVGAAGIERWRFPGAIVTGLRYHHCPEKTESKLAALLYLAEHWCNSGEDLPSVARIRLSIDSLGLELSSLWALEDGGTWKGSALVA